MPGVNKPWFEVEGPHAVAGLEDGVWTLRLHGFGRQAVWMSARGGFLPYLGLFVALS